MIPNWLLQRAYLTPEKIAFTYNDEQWTFKQLEGKAKILAQKLHGNGLTTGNRIALLGPSNEKMVFIIHACMLLGVEVVMVNSRLTKKEIKWQIEDSDAIAVIVSDELEGLISDSRIRKLTFTSIWKSKEKSCHYEEIWEPNRTITIMYTSGTTGFPKGVRQTANNHTSSALSSVLNLGLEEHDVWLCTMPLFHISGFSILVRSVIYGMEVRLYDKFDAVKVTEEIQAGSITRMSVVAVTLNKILSEFEQNETVAHSSFKSVLAGGGPVPIGYLERAARCKIPVLQTYGMTETSSQTATLSAADAMRKIGSAGKPLFFNQIKINDAQHPTEKGEVYIRGPHVTPGYIGRFSDQNPLVDEWLPTGDIGYFDEEGYLYIVDRRSDLIISGGENIYPAEIENVLAGHPHIREVGVCGKDNVEWGSVPIAFVIASEKVTEDDLRLFCEEQLARYKVPAEFRFVDQLPRNASNKLLRRELREWVDLA